MLIFAGVFYIFLSIVLAGSIMNLASDAFTHEGVIPDRYTCNGDDVSPALSRSGVPGGVQSFVLIVDDPDAPGGAFDHLLLFNIQSGVTGLPENVN